MVFVREKPIFFCPSQVALSASQNRRHNSAQPASAQAVCQRHGDRLRKIPGKIPFSPAKSCSLQKQVVLFRNDLAVHRVLLETIRPIPGKSLAGKSYAMIFESKF